MTYEQCESVAAGFMIALKNPALLTEWNSVDSRDTASRAAIVQRTMGLAFAPSAAQMQEVASHVERISQDSIVDFLRGIAVGPNDRTLFCLTQQSTLFCLTQQSTLFCLTQQQNVLQTA